MAFEYLMIGSPRNSDILKILRFKKGCYGPYRYGPDFHQWEVGEKLSSEELNKLQGLCDLFEPKEDVTPEDIIKQEVTITHPYFSVNKPIKEKTPMNLLSRFLNSCESPSGF